ncbi:MAG TPA: alpha-amylase family glycosyl hydrolase [Chthoniobacterales bacterium]
MHRRSFLPIWFALCATCFAAEPTAFIGPIPVQRVAPGKPLVIDMHRFYQPTNESKLEIPASKDADLSFDPTKFELVVTGQTRGIIDVPISVRAGKARLHTVLTLSCADIPTHHFVFKPATPAQKVSLAGSFNGWSGDKTPLSGPDENGEFSADVALDPGRHSYKVVVDGKWILDPANPDSEDNGLGDKNSVVTMRGSDTPPATIYADRQTRDEVVIRTVGQPLAHVSAVVENDNETRVVDAKLDGESIHVKQPTAGVLRVIGCDADGTATNTVVVASKIDRGFQRHDAVMYYAFTDRFADGEKSNDKPVEDPNVAPQANFHGGDLRGVKQHIDDGYFDSLGVNTIWIAPLNRNPDHAYQESPEPHRWYTGYHGYWPVSANEIDPHFGTPADLQALVASAHQHKMRVIADLVLHHVHVEHPWWKEHRDWFGQLELPDGRKNLRLWDEQQFTTWFEPYLPSFDFDNPKAVGALIDNTVWWANTYKLDGFRLDAVKHIIPSFWWKFRSALRERVEKPRGTPLFLVGETFKDRAGIMSFVGPNMLDGQFDFPLYETIKDVFGRTSGDMKLLDDALSSSERGYGKETLMSPLIGNHDKARFMAFADRDLPNASGVKEDEVGWKNPPKVDDAASYKKLMLAQAFLMAIDGVPMIYYGDEIGMTGAGDPDNRRDMRFADQVNADERGVLEDMRKLGAIRKAHPALRYGSRRTLVSDANRYAFVRAHLEDRVAFMLNRADEPTRINVTVAPEMNDGDYNDALSGTKVTIANGDLEIDVPARTAMFITR